VVKFKYLEINLTNQNCIHAEIKSRLNSGNAHHNLVQNLLSSCPLSKNIKIKMHSCIILPTMGIKLGLSHWLRVFKNRVLRKILGPKRDEVTGEKRKLNMSSFLICTSHQTLSG